MPSNKHCRDSDIESNGFAIVRTSLPQDELIQLREYLGPVTGAGRRGILADPQVASLVHSECLLQLIRPYLGPSPKPVRGIYFDKSADANWLVTWHQDLTIAVAEPSDVPGFGPWSTKDGVTHVQPPMAFLEQMLTIRLHLDDADESNGALKVLPGSHRQGRLSNDAIQDYRQQQPEHICCAALGEALLMRPLLLHASGRSTSDRHRRVLHIEYTGIDLPEGMLWYQDK